MEFDSDCEYGCYVDGGYYSAHDANVVACRWILAILKDENYPVWERVFPSIPENLSALDSETLNDVTDELVDVMNDECKNGYFAWADGSLYFFPFDEQP